MGFLTTGPPEDWSSGGSRTGSAASGLPRMASVIPATITTGPRDGGGRHDHGGPQRSPQRHGEDTGCHLEQMRTYPIVVEHKEPSL